MSEPFITLSSGSLSDSNASTSFDDSTPLSTPPSTTHDTSRSSFHIKDLEEFAQDLQNAADRAFPNQGRVEARYKEVSVLLLKWQDDEMGVDWEFQDLKNVFMRYGFNTEEWLIPTRNSHLKLMAKAIEVVEKNDDGDNLVIIYYAGHALINNARQATWSCKADAGYASLEWSAIQTLFEKANFDVLLLLDCCAAASAVPSVGCGVTETIAACGFENSAPQPGRHSFTNTLIEVLEDWIDCPPFSAAMLHNKVLTLLKHERPERTQNGKRRKIECRRTPIHMMGTAAPRVPSIELGRRRPLSLQASEASSLPEPAHEDAFLENKIPPTFSKLNGYQLSDINESNGENFDVPRVIISLRLEEDQNLNSRTCEKWLASCPAMIKFAKVEAVYKSFSTLILLSVPIFVWNLLPENPACSFVGYVTSTNLMASVAISKASKQALTSFLDRLNSGKETNSTPVYLACKHCRESQVDCVEAEPSCERCAKLRYVCSNTTEKMVMDLESFRERLGHKLHGIIDDLSNSAPFIGTNTADQAAAEAELTSKTQKQMVKHSNHSLNQNNKETAHSLSRPDSPDSKRQEKSSDQHSNDFTIQAEKLQMLTVQKIGSSNYQTEPTQHGSPEQRKAQEGEPGTLEPELKAQGRKRTKTGCLSCQRRRIKCTGERPTCLNCQRSGRQCEGYNHGSYSKTPLNAYRGPPGVTIHRGDQSQQGTAAKLLPIAPRPGPLQHEHEWDTIVDTCFSGSEVPFETGAQPQDWIFNFDSPVPIFDSKNRRLNFRMNRSCYTCLIRQLKCDGGSPACMSCKNTGRQCEYESTHDCENSLPLDSTPRTDDSESQNLSSAQRTITKVKQEREVDGSDDGYNTSAINNLLQHDNPRGAQKRHDPPSPDTMPRRLGSILEPVKKTRLDESWIDSSERGEKRRIQNRIAQRRYREKLNKRIAVLARRAGSASPSQLHEYSQQDPQLLNTSEDTSHSTTSLPSSSSYGFTASRNHDDVKPQGWADYNGGLKPKLSSST